MSLQHLHVFLQPASVAVIGASSRPDSLGNWAWRNLVSAGFEGQLLPVNLKHKTLDGHRVYAHVADLPVVPDLALVCTPAATVSRVIDELGAHGTRAAVVLTDGLSPAQTAAMLKAARRYTLRIVGDHALGVQVPRLRLNAGIAPCMPMDGQLALVSQCGGVTASMLDWAQAHGIGFSAVVSLGRSADADAADWLDHLGSDHRTRAILLYLDTVPDPPKFMSAARAAARNKPVIVVKAGASRLAAHGVLGNDAPDAEWPASAVTPDAVFDAAVARAGLLRVGSLQDLFLAAQVLARFRDGGSGPLVILANGGTGALAADAAQALAVPMATLAPDVCAALGRLLGMPAAAVDNPVRVPREAPAQVYAEAAQLLCHDPAHVLLVAHASTVAVRAEDVAQALLPVATRLPHRVMAAWLGGGAHRAAACVFDEAGLPTYDTPEQAVQALALLRTHARHQLELMQTPPARLARVPSDVDGLHALAHAAMAGRPAHLVGDAALQLLSCAGVPVHGAQQGEAAHVPGTRWRITFGVDLTFGPVIGLGTSGLPVALSRHAVALPPLNVPLAHALMARAGASLGPDASTAQGADALLSQGADAPVHGLADMLLSCSQLMVDLPVLAAGQITCVQGQWVAVDAALQLHPARPMGADRFVIQPYPQHLVETLVWQGQLLTVRPIRPEDEAQHLAFLAALSPEDIRMRIFHVRRSIEHSEMARLTQIDYAREMAFIATRVNAETGREETLATARATVDADNDVAEFGVIVRSDIKAGGLGRLLMSRLIAYLAARGTRQLTGTVLAANTRMLALACSLGFVESDNPSDPTDRTVRFVSLDLTHAHSLH